MDTIVLALARVLFHSLLCVPHARLMSHRNKSDWSARLWYSSPNHLCKHVVWALCHMYTWDESNISRGTRHTCITLRDNNLPSLSICYISPPTLRTGLLQWVPGQTGTSWTSRQFIIGASLWPLIIFSPLRADIWEPSCKTHARKRAATPSHLLNGDVLLDARPCGHVMVFSYL